MKKLLKKTDKKDLYYFLGGQKQIIDRADPKTHPSELTGNISNELTGNISGLAGDISGLHGDISGLHGDISGLYGDCSGIMGNIDNCEITDEEREKGVNIQDLIE